MDQAIVESQNRSRNRKVPASETGQSCNLDYFAKAEIPAGSNPCGFFTDDEHQNGIKCAYTRRRRPVELVFSEYFATREEARDVEKQIKGWTRLKKEALIRRDWDELVRLSNLKSEPIPAFARPGRNSRCKDDNLPCP